MRAAERDEPDPRRRRRSPLLLRPPIDGEAAPTRVGVRASQPAGTIIDRLPPVRNTGRATPSRRVPRVVEEGTPLLLERVDREAEEERRRAAREEDERIEGERRAADEARIEEERRREAERVEALANAEAEAEEEARRKGAHVHRAVSLIENLDKVRSSVQGGLAEFDKSKAVSRRRLQFQKIVNGKINTLTHDAGKILEVGGAVCDAIENAARDDAENSGPRQEPVLSVGKKYLLDLLCSNLVVRVQADGFNGTRGDGFPLANAFAHVSTRCEEIGPVLEGHLYTVCPMAIPVLRWS